MKPSYRIKANGDDITALLNARLISLTITDEAGQRSDVVRIEVDNRDGKVALPKTGAEIEAWIGYDGRALEYKGLYIVDEIAVNGPPATLAIGARAANMHQSLKAPKTRAWDGVTIAGLVGTIASEHGLAGKVSQDLATIAFDHLDQTEESDLHFLTRLGNQHDAIAKPADGNLIFVPKGQSKSFSGKTMSRIALGQNEVISYRMQAEQRGKYGAAIANWQDMDGAELVPEKAGTGEPVFVIRQTYPDAAQAKAAATAKLQSLDRGAASLNLSTIGVPELAAETRLALSGIAGAVDGEWSVVRVSHELSSGGYTCQIDAETPKGMTKPVLN